MTIINLWVYEYLWVVECDRFGNHYIILNLTLCGTVTVPRLDGVPPIPSIQVILDIFSLMPFCIINKAFPNSLIMQPHGYHYI